MGGAASAAFSFWSADEAVENERALARQKTATEFLLKYLFYGVPVRKAKKSADPKSPLWIEIHPDLLSSVIGKRAEECTDFNEQLLRSLPTGIVIDSKGKIKVLFTLFTATEITYEFTVQDVINIQQAQQLETLGRFKTYAVPQPYSNNFTTRHEVNLYRIAPQPLPPTVVGCTHDSISLSTLTSVPQPVGIVQQVEIQYALVSTGTTVVPLGSTTAISSIASRQHKRKFILAYIEQQQQLLQESEAEDRRRIEALIRRHHAEKDDENLRLDTQRLQMLKERDRAAGVPASRHRSADVEELESRIAASQRRPSPSASQGSGEGSPVLLSERRYLAGHDDETNGADLDEDDAKATPVVPVAVAEAKTPFLWHSLVTRSYEHADFGSYTFERLQPGEGYVFRLRYRNHLAFSPYSLPTTLVCTRAAPPSAPDTPILGTVTSSSVMLFWQPPARDNGSSITHFVLRARSVGAEWVVLYCGAGCSFVATDLFPDFAYSFQVAAVNSLGQSAFSDSLSTQTPPRARLEQALLDGGLASILAAAGGAIGNPLSAPYATAMRCAMAWRELWDPGSQQVFYFNLITSVRQLERPQCLGSDEAAAGAADADGAGAGGRAPLSLAERARQREVNFRKKRYQLLRALHKEKGGSGGGGGGGSPSKNTTLLVTLDRSSLLGDAYARLAPPSMPPKAPDLAAKRLRFAFVGEEGIDSGGIGKEAFLLISRACARYLGGNFRCLLRELRDCPPPSSVPAPAPMQPASASVTKRASSRLQQLIRRASSQKVAGGAAELAASQDAAAAALEEEQEEQRYAKAVGAVEAEVAASLDDAATAGAGGLFVHEGKDGDSLARNAAASKRLRERAATNASGAPLPTLTDEESISDKTERVLESVAAENLAFFFGRLLGKAVADRQLVDVRLSGLLLAHMAGDSEPQQSQPATAAAATSPAAAAQPKAAAAAAAAKASPANAGGENNSSASATRALQQLRQLDPELHRSLQWMLQNDITGVLDNTFSVSVEQAGGRVAELALCPDGLTRAVTEENKAEYVCLMSRWKSRYAVQPLLEPLLRGFHELVPLDSLRAAGISALELGLLLSGRERIDVDDLRPYVVYQSVALSDAELAAGVTPFGEHHEQVVWFWQCCRELSQPQLRALLRFFTGSSRIPVDGFDPPLALTQGVDMAQDSLPRAHTCFNQLVLGPYSHLSIMRDKLVFAAENSLSFDLS